MNLKMLNAITFEEVIFDNGEACLIVFSRKSCHVCQEVVPMLEQLADKFTEKFGFYYVDVEDEKDLFKRFSLKGVPQILFFDGGEYQGKFAGLVEENKVMEKIAGMI